MSSTLTSSWTRPISRSVPDRHGRSIGFLESVRQDSDEERGDDGNKLHGSPATREDVSCSWKSPHRTAKPLPSILKRSMPHSRSHLEQGIEEAYEDINDDFHSGDRDDDYEESYTNRFDISVVRYHTSCCKVLVCIEQISDWIVESSSSKRHHHFCPSCMFPCILNEPNSDSTFTPASASASFSSSTSSLSTSSPRQILSKLLSFALFELRQQGSGWPSPLPFPKITVSYPHSLRLSLPSQSPSPPPLSTSDDTDYHLDQSYTLFNTDDEAYPETEHTPALSSNLFSTDVQETSVRILNVAGLTLVLFVLLSSTGVGLF